MQLIIGLLFLISSSFAAEDPVELVMVKVTPNQGTPYYALFPYTSHITESYVASVHELILKSKGTQKIIQKIGPEQSGTLRVDLSNLNPKELCFGDRQKCIEPLGTIKLMAPFGQECQKELPKSQSDLGQIKELQFYFTLTLEQKIYLQNNFSYAHYVMHCHGSKLHLPAQSPYGSSGCEYKGFQWIYKNLKLPAFKNSKVFSQITLYGKDCGEDYANYEGLLDPKAPDYVQVRNSILHSCPLPERKEELYLAETEQNHKSNTIILTDLPASVLAAPKETFSEKLSAYLLANSTASYRAFLKKLNQDLDVPQEAVMSELYEWMKKLVGSTGEDAKKIKSANLTFHNFDFRASCLTDKAAIKWGLVENCFKVKFEATLAKAADRTTKIKHFKEWQAKVKAEVVKLGVDTEQDPDFPFYDFSRTDKIRFTYQELDFAKLCINPARWYNFVSCASSLLMKTQAEETEQYKAAHSPLQVSCQQSEIEDPAEQISN